MFCTYILQSESTSKWYIGHTSDVGKRLEEHNSGSTKSTKGKGPWRLVFVREFETKVEANRFELELKRMRNKDYIKRLYREYFI